MCLARTIERNEVLETAEDIKVLAGYIEWLKSGAWEEGEEAVRAEVGGVRVVVEGKEGTQGKDGKDGEDREDGEEGTEWR